MIQDSHVVALHISLRCVEVAACAGHVWVRQHHWRSVSLNVMNVTMMKARPTGRHSFSLVASPIDLVVGRRPSASPLSKKLTSKTSI